MEGPFDPNSDDAKETTLSPLQSVPRPDGGKERIIHNLSKNKHLGLSVNSFIAEKDKYVQYSSIRDIVSLLQFIGPMGYICVWDMFEAYRQVKIEPKYRRFMGFKWYGKVYRYAALPFGLASAPKLYSEFAELIRIITIASDPDLWSIQEYELLYNYLDDFWSAHKDLLSAWKQFVSFLDILGQLGIPTQWRKVKFPTKIAKILGFIFNIEMQIFYVPYDKVVKICIIIDKLLDSTFATKKEIASIKGKLSWCTQVIRPTKAFLRGFDEIIARPIDWHRNIRLSAEIKADLSFFKNAIQSAHNAISFEYFLRNPNQGEIHVWTDAAIKQGTGIGGFASSGHYFQVAWDKLKMDWPWPRNDSSGPELLAVVMFGVFIASLHPNSSILFHCDNIAVVPIINNEVCSLRKKSHMALVRYFVAQMFELRMKFWVEHIPGEMNIEADSLSRFKNQPFQRLYKKPYPSDEWITPFYSKNPQFSDSFKFKFVNLFDDTLYCMLIASNYQ